MKSLILVRHAKSSWDDPSLSDFDRPLNERGRKDAPAMAKRLAHKGILPDILVTSPARRALKTAEAFAAELDVPRQSIIPVESLYMASPMDFLHVVTGLSDQAQTVALFSHNPGITDFANTLDTAHIDHFPTCAVLGIHADITHWKDFQTARKTFWFFDYPKNPGA